MLSVAQLNILVTIVLLIILTPIFDLIFKHLGSLRDIARQLTIATVATLITVTLLIVTFTAYSSIPLYFPLSLGALIGVVAGAYLRNHLVNNYVLNSSNKISKHDRSLKQAIEQSVNNKWLKYAGSEYVASIFIGVLLGLGVLQFFDGLNNLVVGEFILTGPAWIWGMLCMFVLVMFLPGFLLVRYTKWKHPAYYHCINLIISYRSTKSEPNVKSFKSYLKKHGNRLHTSEKKMNQKLAILGLLFFVIIPLFMGILSLNTFIHFQNSKIIVSEPLKLTYKTYRTYEVSDAELIKTQKGSELHFFIEGKLFSISNYNDLVNEQELNDIYDSLIANDSSH